MPADKEPSRAAETGGHGEWQRPCPAAAGHQPSDKQPQPPVATADQDFHLLITQRIAALQQERQSLWQRIFNFLTTNPPSEPPRK